MFMFSFRLSRRRLIAGAAALVFVVGLTVTAVKVLGGGDAMASATPVGESASEKVKSQKITAKTNEDRLAFIESFGWEAAADPKEIIEVIIPEEFDPVYQDYNALQKKQGFDLEKYKGKRCKRYTYVITNYPAAECEVQLNLLLYGDRLVGGDVCSTEADGFMHGFSAQ